MLNKLTKILLTVIIAYTVMWAQTDKNKIIVAKYDNQNITLKEFEKAFLKNAGSVDKAKKANIKEYQNFLRLYVNYKLKLADAEKRGLNNDPSITKELNEYKESIASSFLIEKRLIEPAIKKLYDERKLEYRVSHIMFIPQKGKEDSTFKMAQTVLKSIKNGIDFETLAKKYSQDQNSAKEGGDIYYITAGFLPVPFENAVYSMKVGQVYPKVVKTRYGYHIIKVTDIRERVPEIRASHILISFANKGKIDSAGALKQAKLILDSLKHGGKFEDLAKKFSNDTGSKEKGGDLGFFKRRRMVKPFDEAAFNLKKVGDLSDIVTSRYGYHIIKLTGKLSLPTYEKDRENLIDLFKKNRYDQALNKLSEQLQKKYKYVFKTTNFVKLVKSSDTLKVGQTNNTLNKIKSLPIFTFKNKSYSIGQVLKLIKDKKENKNKKMSSNFMAIEIDKIAKEKALELEASRLEKLNPQFADLMKEYKKGLLIFKLQQEEVWNNIKSDSVRLRDYFNKNRKRFKWPDKVDFTEIFSRSDSLIKHYVELIKKGESFDTLAAKYTERGGFKAKGGNWGLRNANFNDLCKKAFTLEKPGDISDLYENYGGYSIIRLNKKLPSKLKTYKEAKNEVAASYQEFEARRLANKYLSSLVKKYNPVFYSERLSEAFK